MTDDTPEASASQDPQPPPEVLRRIGPVGRHVEACVRGWISSLASPTTGAQLAQLRAAVARVPGSAPAVWDVTVGRLADPQARDDEPTAAEWAAHVALTLYAVHQQGRDRPMHVAGWGLGSSIARLADTLDRPDAVRRRFDAVATASSQAEVAHHLRGLITQLRSEEIPLDYAMLADDLLRFHRDGDPNAVRRRWARQYYRLERRTKAQRDASDDPTDVSEPNGASR